jgi:CheY-like chemotaxis protein
MMSGEIGVQSDVNKGSRFFFTIKLSFQTAVPANDSINNISKIYDIKEDKVEDVSQIADSKSKRGKFNILLAEDNFINQKVCMHILNEAGFKADTVVNGFEAIEAVKKHSYNLILMDVQMPECDGFTATKQIRNLGSSYEKIPIFAITAHALMGDKEKCIEAGMNDYISKPIVSENLIKLMDNWLNINSTAIKPPIIEQNNKMENIFDFDHLDKMSIGSVEFQLDLVTTFIDDMDKRFDVLESHFNSGNLDKMVNEAHTIKGSSLSVGAILVGRDALEVEMVGKQKDLPAIPGKLSNLKKSIAETKDILTQHFNISEV